jgi:hypothetical protein
VFTIYQITNGQRDGIVDSGMNAIGDDDSYGFTERIPDGNYELEVYVSDPSGVSKPST